MTASQRLGTTVFVVTFLVISARSALAGGMTLDPIHAQEAADPAELSSACSDPLASWILEASSGALLDPAEEIAPEIAALARAELTALLEVLATRKITDPADGRSIQATWARRAAVLTLLGAVERAAVWAALDAWLATEGPHRLRVTIQVLGQLGGASELERILELANVLASRDELRSVERELPEAVAAVLARDHRARRLLVKRGSRTPRELLPAVAEGVGAAGDPLGLELLLYFVRRDRDLAPLALAQMQCLGPSESRKLNEGVRALAREHFDGGESALSSAACQLLGVFRDQESIPRMVEQLASGSPAIRANAGWSLRSATGLAFRDVADLWTIWHEVESARFKSNGAADLADLRASDDATVLQAIGRLSGYSVRRQDIAAALESCLSDASAAVRTRACAALGQLGEVDSAPALRALLEDWDPEVQEAARAALLACGGTVESS